MKKGFNLTLLLFISLAVACGGSKETVTFEPDPFPEPPPRTPQPISDPAPEPVKPLETDIPKGPVVLSTIYFPFDQSNLTADTKALLAQNARKMQENPEINIRIEGHCDERGTVEYNLALGQRRAIATREYLMSYGISPGRVTIISYGKERPADPRHIESAWGQNRRAKFVILN